MEKELIQKICVGLSVFVVALAVSVSVRNTGNTYAVTYSCPDGYIEASNNSNYCCPNNGNSYEYNTDAQNMCSRVVYTTSQCIEGETGTDTLSELGAICSIGGVAVVANTESCWSCPDGDYYWSVDQPVENCQNVTSSYSTSASCEAANNSSLTCEVTYKNCDPSDSSDLNNMKSYCNDIGGTFSNETCSYVSSSCSEADYICVNTYSVTFDANGGSIVGSSTLSCDVEQGESSCLVGVDEELPTALKDEYTFTGWGISSNCTSGSTTTLYLTEDSSIRYACYTENEESGGGNNSGTGENSPDTDEIITVTATFDANGGTLVDSDSSTKQCLINVSNGESSCSISSLPTARKGGYTFTGWGTTAACIDGNLSVTLSENTTYYACYVYTGSEGTSATYTATFNANGGELNGNSSSQCTVSSDTNSCMLFVLPTATKEGYTFTGWGTTSSCGSGQRLSLELTSNEEFFACFIKDDVSGSDNNNDNQEITENPTTGNWIIYIVYIIGVVALGYTGYNSYKLIKSKQ